MNARILIGGGLVALFAVLTATPGSAEPVLAAGTLGAQPAGAIHVVEIALSGNKHVKTRAILEALGLHEGQDVSADQLRNAVQRVVEMGTFSAVEPNAEPASLGGIRLTIHVTENPVLKAVRIEGATLFDAETLARYFAPMQGQVIAAPDVKRAIDKVDALYASRGLVLARLFPLTMTPSGVLVMQMREGRLHALRIDGNTRTHESVIRRELTLKKGELITRDQLQGDLDRLGRLGYFDDVKPLITPATGSLGYDLTMQVTERNTGSVSASGGWSALDGPLASLALSNSNFMGRGQTLGASLMVSRIFDPTNRYLNGDVNFTEPWLDSERTSLGTSIYMHQLYNPFIVLDNGAQGFMDQRAGASVTLGRPLFGDPISTPWRGFVSMKGEDAFPEQMSPTGSRTPLPLATASGTGHDLGFSSTLGIQYDTRNNAINPSYGSRFKVAGEQYAPLADLRMSDVQFEAAHYVPIAPFLTLAFGTRGGTDFDLFGGRIPTYARFFSYGDALLRGYLDGTFNGNSYLLGTVEARFPIFKAISGAVFGDTGSFWGTQNPTILSGWRSGYGLGIRVDSPVGLIRADYGLYALGAPGQFSIGVGQRF